MDLSSLSPREQFSYMLGKTHGGERDVYDAFGWKKSLDFKDYKRKYDRDGLAHRIVSIFPAMTWKKYPIIKTNEDSIKSEIKELNKKKSLYHYLERVDRISRIGEYGVLLIGLDDGRELDQPVNESNIDGLEDILYFSVFMQKNAEIKETNSDATDKRFRLPEIYQLTVDDDGDNKKDQTIDVHHSRVIHIAENLDEGEVRGTPCLKDVYNQIDDLRKVLGSSAEAYYKLAVQNVLFNIDKEVNLEEDDKEEIKENVKRLEHDQKQYVYGQGMDAQVLQSDMNSPRYTADNIFSFIAGSKGIPQRILKGSERGELASSMDIITFYSNVEARRTKHVEPRIVEPLLRKLQNFGVLSEGKIDLKWPELYDMSEVERSQMIENYANSINKLLKVKPELLTNAEIRKEFLNFPVETDKDQIVNQLAEEIENKGNKELAEQLRDKEDKWKLFQSLKSLLPNVR